MTESSDGRRYIVEADRQGRTLWPILGIAGGVAIAAVSLASGGWMGAAIGASVSGWSGLAGRKTLPASLRWKAPELVLPVAALQMETPVEIHYRRRSRKIRDVSSADLRLTLVCEEHVQWNESSTDAAGESTSTTRHKREEVYRSGVVGSVEGTADGLDGVAWLTVPATAGAPSFDEGSNDVKWWIDAELHGAGMPEDHHRFDVVVLPELGAGFQTRYGSGLRDS